ncbi:MAG: alanine racemase [Eubacteriales bacterium]
MARAYVEVDLDAIKNNIREIKNHLSENTRIMAVVKADAYGHGCIPCATAAIEAGAKWLAVATPEEGKVIRDAGIKNRILILGAIEDDEIDMCIDLGLDLCVFSSVAIEKIAEIAKKKGKVCRIHIKIDTGMGRIGIRTIGELKSILSSVEKHKNIELAGIFSHFPSADTAAHDETTRKQLDKFLEFAKYVKDRGFTPLLHISNSAACIKFNEAQLDMIRLGISMYGIYPSPEMENKVVKLSPAMKVLSKVVFVKDIDKGDTISYGQTFKASAPMKIATISIGYGDGFKRLLSGKGSVLIHGKRAPIVGRVCMDQMMVDVTDIEGVVVGDEVVCLGKQGEEEITADEIAELCDTISYEIVLSFLQMMLRVYLT